MAYSQTITFNTVLTSALQDFLKESPVEQNYTHTAALGMLERKSRSMDAPSYWRVPVRNVGSPLGGPFEGASTTATTGFDDVTMASYRRCQYAEPVVLLITDEWDTSSNVALFKASVTKLESAKLKIRTDVSTDLLSTTAVSMGLQGIPLMAEESPSSAVTYGGLDGSVDTFWRNKTDSTVAFSTGGMAAFESMFRQLASVEGGQSNPFDWILVSRNVYGFMQTAGRTYLTLFDKPVAGAAAKRAADLGFPVLNFHGKPIVFDAGMSDGFAYFMRDDAAYLVTQPGIEFTMPREWVLLAGAGQHGQINYVYWRGQLVCEHRAAVGQIDTITA